MSGLLLDQLLGAVPGAARHHLEAAAAGEAGLITLLAGLLAAVAAELLGLAPRALIGGPGPQPAAGQVTRVTRRHAAGLEVVSQVVHGDGGHPGGESVPAADPSVPPANVAN